MVTPVINTSGQKSPERGRKDTQFPIHPARSTRARFARSPPLISSVGVGATGSMLKSPSLRASSPLRSASSMLVEGGV